MSCSQNDAPWVSASCRRGGGTRGSNTESHGVLTFVDSKRAFHIGGPQIASDRKALREWHEALKAADEFWADHPDWSFGQCLDAIMRATGLSPVAGEAV